jgi:hypothetical protein
MARKLDEILASPVNVLDYGATGDGTTDDTAAFVAALVAVEDGGIIDLGGTPHTYLIKETLVITKSIKIVGGTRYNNTLLFASDGVYLAAPYKCGILVVHPNTIVPGYASATATGTVLSGFKVEMQAGPTDMSGIISSTVIFIENVWAQGFSEDGIHIHAHAALGTEIRGNANYSNLTNCMSNSNGRHGFYVEGNNANVISFVNCSASLNTEYGFYDDSSYGGIYIACATDGNADAFYGSDSGLARAVYLGCYCESNQDTYYDNTSPVSIRINPQGEHNEDVAQEGISLRAIESNASTVGRLFLTKRLIFADTYTQAFYNGIGANPGAFMGIDSTGITYIPVAGAIPFTLGPTGMVAPIKGTATTSSGTINAAAFATYYGKTVFLTKADGAIAIAIAADGVAAGTCVRFIVTGANHNSNIVFTSETADTLITFNDVKATTLTFGNGQRTGAKVLFISDGTKWIAINESNNTMTVG